MQSISRSNDPIFKTVTVHRVRTQNGPSDAAPRSGPAPRSSRWQSVGLETARGLTEPNRFRNAESLHEGPNLFGLLIALAGLSVYVVVPAAIVSYFAL